MEARYPNEQLIRYVSHLPEYMAVCIVPMGGEGGWLSCVGGQLFSIAAEKREAIAPWRLPVLFLFGWLGTNLGDRVLGVVVQLGCRE